ncbi:glutathione S-transferase A-like [Saccoglossus kowalevskii]|uniref:Glutathione S-transferase A-like n=1 Tax=Saccoglossus kowalevskii TaxID=10224 RepID=A0ABM0GJW3_SACKO|nr:PREDICTED: glutathione S-transferase A-like [Saccoglossus kowalevskii]
MSVGSDHNTAVHVKNNHRLELLIVKMASEFFLYWGSGSSPCWRVMITLEEKGLSGYGNKLVSFEKSEHKSEDILKLNPRGQVPTLKHGDIVINESIACMLYLQCTFKDKGNSLLPCSGNPAFKARVLQRLMEVNNIQSAVRGVMMYMRKNKDNIDEAQLGPLKEALRTELKRWDDYLKETGDYIAGPSFSLADCAFFPFVAVLRRQGLDLSKNLPNLSKYYEQHKDRPSIQASWPPHFKETPDQDNLAKLYD